MKTITIPSNNAITWQGTRFGLKPQLSLKVEEILKQEDRAAINKIALKAIKDENKFVTAHVLLTFISKMEYETFPSWNKLNVEIMPDGTTHISVDQKIILYDFWANWLQSNPS